METQKRVLLIDLDDPRRATRVRILVNAGYRVDVRTNCMAAEQVGDEADYDMVILALHRGPKEASIYSDQLTRKNPALAILLLTDTGVYAPPGTLSRSLEAGNAKELLKRVAEMLTGSEQITELSQRPEAQQ